MIRTVSSSFPILMIHTCPAILQDDLIDNLSTQDASPPLKMFMGTVECFVGHWTSATMALYPEIPRRFCSHNVPGSEETSLSLNDFFVKFFNETLK